MALESAASKWWAVFEVTPLLYIWYVLSLLMMKCFKLGTFVFTLSPRISYFNTSLAMVDATKRPSHLVKSNCSKIRTIHHCWDENSSIFNVAVDSKSNRDSVAVENSSILNSLEWENSSILRKNITSLEIINKVVQKIINGMEEHIS